MKLDRQFALRTAIEGLLIVFSVLLALFLSEVWSERSERAATREQLVSIQAELEENRVILDDWLERHAAIGDNIAGLRASGETDLFDDGQLSVGKVFGRSLADTMVRDTAWETAKTSGLVRRFDLDCANLLTDIYGLQKAVERQIWSIADRIGERETHQSERLPQTLVVLDLGFQELQGQERLLDGAYEDALEALDEGQCHRTSRTTAR